MIREAIEKVVKGVNLSEEEMGKAFDEIMSGQAAPSQIAAFIVALRMKGETVEEITGAAKVMREKSVRISVGGTLVGADTEESESCEEAIVDTCGTGGSGLNTFNISTASSFVVAGCGVKVAKHGNRSASSQCGSADVLEALGVKLDIGADLTARCIREIGIGFLYAPLFHSAMKYAVVPRREIGIRTIFNILGPLSNPAGATSQVLGIYDSNLTEVLAKVLKNLGLARAFVAAGMDKLDEITITERTKITELVKGRLKTYYISPEKFGMKRATLDDIKGGSAKENAETIRSILKGERSSRRDVVLLNSSAALIAAFRTKDFRSGIKLAEESIDSGRAREKLEQLIRFSNQ